MLVIIAIVITIFIWFSIFCFIKNKNKNNCKKRKIKECFVENYVDNVAQGQQIMLSDSTGNLSTFDVSTNKMLITDKSGNITTIDNGLFKDTVIASNGINGTTGYFSNLLTANGGFTGTTITGTTGTFSNLLSANGGFNGATGTFSNLLSANGGFTGTTGTFSSLLNANGGFTGTTGTFSSLLNANGGFTGTDGTFSNLLRANGGFTGTNGTFSNLLSANGGITGTNGFFRNTLNANGGFTGTNGTFSSLLNANGGLASTTITGTTGTFSNLLSANGGITGNLTGNSSTSDRVRLLDTRNDNSLPSYYASKVGVTYEFKTAAVIGITGLNGFVLLETLVPWSDNSAGLQIKQTATVGKDKYTRYAMPLDTSWGSWEGNFLETGVYNTRLGRINIWGGDRTINADSHFNYNGTSENYISGKTYFRGSDAAPICIGSTCITEDDLKKIKNNTFPSLNIDGTLAIRKPDSTNFYTAFNQSDSSTLKMTSSYDGNAYIYYNLAGDPNINVKGYRLISNNDVRVLNNNSGYNGTVVKTNDYGSSSWASYNNTFLL